MPSHRPTVFIERLLEMNRGWQDMRRRTITGLVLSRGVDGELINGSRWGRNPRISAASTVVHRAAITIVRRDGPYER